MHFERALALDDVRETGALLAYAMNGDPLPVQHGFPLRLVVPGWYAVASVKWVTDIELLGGEFDGYFQADRYMYEWERDGAVVREPVRLQQVRSIITEPTGDVAIPAGELVVRGVAWSGAAPIARVDVRVDDGPWLPARLIGERQRGRWQWWELITRHETPGDVVVRARATDLADRTQPDAPAWNRLGYGGNAIQALSVNLV
jgi:DMSO/TMAO reductase YedYZ molybdopterin-dependent catalytic subunit